MERTTKFAYQHVDDAYRDLVEFVMRYGNHKANRTGTDTKSVFGYSYKLNTSRFDFPLLTTKRVSFRNIVAENLWFLSGVPNIQPLWDEDIHFWDEWADEDGKLETAYGRYWRHFPMMTGFTTKIGPLVPTMEPIADLGDEYVHRGPTGRQCFDQIQWILDGLRENPNSRRYVLSAWHPGNSTVSRLPACHCLSVWNVQNGKLNCHLTQRSGDIGLGIPYNIAGYNFLLRLFAHHTGLGVGSFHHTIVDAHIYENHEEALREQLERPQHHMPMMTFNGDKGIFDLEVDDFNLHHYNHAGKLNVGEVAV